MKRASIFNGFPMLFLICISQVQAAEKTLEFSFSPDQVTMEKSGDYHQIRLDNGSTPLWDAGSPDIPCRYVNILLPSGAVPTNVTATVEETLLAEEIWVYPHQLPRSLSDTSPVIFVSPDATAYAAAVKTPVQSVEMGNLQTMRGYTYLTVRLNPLRYIPSEKQLYLATNCTLTVEYESSVQATSVSLMSTGSSSGSGVFEDIVSGLVVNPEDMVSSSSSVKALAVSTVAVSTSSAVDYLIVTSPALTNSFQTLADYRAAQDGLTTEVISTNYIAANYSGVDFQAKMRACVEDYYDDGDGLIYLVIGGDDTVVPDRDCYVTVNNDAYVEEEMPTDLYFSGLDSTWDEDGDGIYGEANYSGSLDEGDLAPEVLVGRIPVRTASQADAYIDKLINFETNGPSSTFYYKMMFLGDTLFDGSPLTGDDRPSDLINDGLSEFEEHSPVSDAEIWQRRKYRDVILPWWEPIFEYAAFFDTLTSWDADAAGDYEFILANVITRLNEGWYFVDMSTHGNTTIWSMETNSAFSSTSASSLSGMTAIISTMACLSGGFDQSSDPCLSEAFLRNGDGGALAYMGCSRYGWGYTFPDDNGGPSSDYVEAFYEQVFENEVLDIGQAFAASKASMISNSGYNGAYRWIQFGLNFQGDPAMQILTSVVTPPDVSDSSVQAFVNEATEIVLQAQDEGLPASPGALEYIITSLPSSGSLSDPESGSIDAVPYTLADNGNTVFYSSGVSGSDSFTFKANDGGTSPEGGDSDIATVSVSVVGLIAEFNMDSDPGWSTEGLWEFGVPTGGGGAHGSPDPTLGYTGTNVYGYNLDGDYTNSLSEKWLTTTAIDCSDYTNVAVAFQRWLGVESPSWDHAYFDVSINGSGWSNVWQNTSEITDSAWTEVEYDISAIADGQSSVYLRWGMGTTDSSVEYCGWNIDDVVLTGSNIDSDSDGDGLPDWWETQYYGGAASANTNDLAANGLNTVWDAYVAGFNPTNPSASFLISDISLSTSESIVQWQDVSDRVYSVYWSSNLLSGFEAMPFASNITSGVYTDSVHSADSEGFYRIEVELEP
jgi:hypothetical protein